MEFENIARIIFKEIKQKIESNEGLSIFAAERAKFEGWLKVELCDSLCRHYANVTPERNRVDVTCDEWAIELKTVNTNIRYDNVKSKIRPITKNVQGVIIDDIKKLKKIDYHNKAILVAVFPIKHDNGDWQVQLQRFSSSLLRIKHVQFYFKKDIPGVLYLGLVK